METVRNSETSANLYETVRIIVPEVCVPRNVIRQRPLSKPWIINLIN